MTSFTQIVQHLQMTSKWATHLEVISKVFCDLVIAQKLKSHVLNRFLKSEKYTHPSVAQHQLTHLQTCRMSSFTIADSSKVSLMALVSFGKSIKFCNRNKEAFKIYVDHFFAQFLTTYLLPPVSIFTK